jgi:hypothetical protein
MLVISFAPLSLYPRYALYKRLGGPQACEDFVEKRNLLHLPGIKPRFFGRPDRTLVAILTEVFIPISFTNIAENILNCTK